VLAETIRHLAILTRPFMPQSSARLLDFLAVPSGEPSFAALETGKLKPGSPAPTPEAIFPRYIESGMPPL
jgi:methionyl-tRNA synthetase